MALSEKQKAVISFALNNGNEITKKQAMLLINDHFRNGEKHVGDVLSRMVKQGLLVRVKRGVFKLGNPKKNIAKNYSAPNQTELF